MIWSVRALAEEVRGIQEAEEQSASSAHNEPSVCPYKGRSSSWAAMLCPYKGKKSNEHVEQQHQEGEDSNGSSGIDSASRDATAMSASTSSSGSVAGFDKQTSNENLFVNTEQEVVVGSSSSSSSSSAATSSGAEKCPINHSTTSSSAGGCPVASSSSSSPTTMAESRGSRLNKALLSSAGGTCPMRARNPDLQASHGEGAVATGSYYHDKNLRLDVIEPQGGPSSPSSSSDSSTGLINPRNMMPTMRNEALPSDLVQFDKNREVSSIPKTGEDQGTTWVYPSPQQFYNALRRRGKVDEEDELEKDNTMDAIVFAHNVTNERTWEEILDWERMHMDRCKNPTLLSFVGKSEELSLGGHFSSYFRSRGAPFDRHDWVVDRCGLEKVRYIIDYYDDPNAGADDEHGLDISLVTRPAATDGFRNIFDILRKPLWDAGILGGKKKEQQDA
ncbi:unnamed protein product [Amoebophrya sp. A25]|nr:unnamed protein product [Amoebophrya sp. A25]|eukprot:GSA25T00023177001.1